MYIHIVCSSFSAWPPGPSAGQENAGRDQCGNGLVGDAQVGDAGDSLQSTHQVFFVERTIEKCGGILYFHTHPSHIVSIRFCKYSKPGLFRFQEYISVNI